MQHHLLPGRDPGAEFRARQNTQTGNKLEAPKRDCVGQHSIRINDQWRVCFMWTDVGLEGVEITDYH